MVVGCSAVGPSFPASASVRKGVSDNEAISVFKMGRRLGVGMFNAGIRRGRALSRNLYTEVNVPRHELTQLFLIAEFLVKTHQA